MPKPSQILKSVGKTINLAKPQVYQVPRKPPLNSLVFEKLPEPRCGDRIAINKPPAPKPVRICTKEELQAMYCCPCPCDCKVKGRKSTLAQKIGYLFKTAAKIALIHQMVKITWKEGLWSDGFHSSCLLGKFLEYCPEEKEEPINEYGEPANCPFPEKEPCLPIIPRSDLLLYRLSYLWNQIVITVFWVILEGPYEFWQFILALFTPKQKVPDIDPCDAVRARKRR